MRYIEFPKFKIEKAEVRIDKQKLKKFLGIGITSVFGYYIYTQGIDKLIRSLLEFIPFINELFQIIWVKVFVLSILIYYVRNAID